VFRWNNISGVGLGSPLSGDLVETLDPSFHADPSLLKRAWNDLTTVISAMSLTQPFQPSPRRGWMIRGVHTV